MERWKGTGAARPLPTLLQSPNEEVAPFSKIPKGVSADEKLQGYQAH